MLDRFIDMQANNLIGGLLGSTGKPGGGVFGNLLSGLMGVGQQNTATMNVNAGLVNIGGIGAPLNLAGAGAGGSGGGLFGELFKFLLPSSKGNAFSGGHLMAFASGGVVDRPTLFPMARGAGLMGEAGPEAILPLRRGSDGRLGVSAQQGGGRSVVNIHNYGNSEVRTEDRGEGPDGSRMLDIFIEEKVNSMLTSGRGDAAMTRFGSRPAKVRWGG